MEDVGRGHVHNGHANQRYFICYLYLRTHTCIYIMQQYQCDGAAGQPTAFLTLRLKG